jgi:hypothetical protein
MNVFFGRRVTMILAALIALSACNRAHASIEYPAPVTFGFTKTSDDHPSVPDVSAQLSVTLYDPVDHTLPDLDFSVGGTQTLPIGHGILFVFSNSGPAASSLTDVYFSDTAGLLKLVAGNSPGIWNKLTNGVDFSKGATPASPPGNSFVVTTSADSNPPAQSNGVNPLQALGVSFQLNAGAAFNDVVQAFGTTLTIAAKVQGLDGGGSTWHEAPNGPPPPPTLPPGGGNGTPEATSIAIWSLLACSAGVVVRRRRKTD